METINIKPLEVRDITMDFGADVGYNDNISSVVTTCIDTKTGDDVTGSIVYGHFFNHYNSGVPAKTDTWVQVLAGGGADGDIFKLKSVITTALGLVFEKEVLLCVSDWYDDEMYKAEGDVENFSVDFAAWMPFRGTALIGLGFLFDGTWIADGSIPYTGGFSPWLAPAIVITRISDGVDVTADMLASFTPAGTNKEQSMLATVTLKGGTAGELYQVAVVFSNGFLYFEYDLLLTVI